MPISLRHCLLDALDDDHDKTSHSQIPDVDVHDLSHQPNMQMYGGFPVPQLDLSANSFLIYNFRPVSEKSRLIAR